MIFDFYVHLSVSGQPIRREKGGALPLNGYISSIHIRVTRAPVHYFRATAVGEERKPKCKRLQSVSLFYQCCRFQCFFRVFKKLLKQPAEEVSLCLEPNRFKYIHVCSFIGSVPQWRYTCLLTSRVTLCDFLHQGQFVYYGCFWFVFTGSVCDRKRTQPKNKHLTDISLKQINTRLNWN